MNKCILFPIRTYRCWTKCLQTRSSASAAACCQPRQIHCCCYCCWCAPAWLRSDQRCYWPHRCCSSRCHCHSMAATPATRSSPCDAFGFAAAGAAVMAAAAIADVAQQRCHRCRSCRRRHRRADSNPGCCPIEYLHVWEKSRKLMKTQ